MDRSELNKILHLDLLLIKSFAFWKISKGINLESIGFCRIEFFEYSVLDSFLINELILADIEKNLIHCSSIGLENLVLLFKCWKC